MKLGFAYGLFGVGALITVLNFYLSIIRPVICRSRHLECRHESGIPLFGSLFLVISVLLLPEGHALRRVGLVVALFDTAGLHWFCGMMLYMLAADRLRTGRDPK